MRQEIQVHDCSDKEKSNLTTTMLHLYGPRYGVFFTPDYEDADVIFTNDSFPDHIISDKLRIKRMGTIGWQYQQLIYNKKHCDAIKLADHVIFESNYGKELLANYCPNARPKKSSVIPNQADPNIFFPDRERESIVPQLWIAAVDDWSKPEHRLDLVLDFARKIRGSIILLGKSSAKIVEFPGNAYAQSDVDYTDLPELFRAADAFLSLSHRESCSDYVSMALACGLPILYADSGGTKEIVGDVGIGIKDVHYTYQPSIPSNITPEQLKLAYSRFCFDYVNLRKKALMVDQEARFEKALYKYFKIFLEYSGVYKKMHKMCASGI